MTNFESHPLAELIPAMTDAEYAALREDIEQHGLRESLTLYEGKVLDGRHRARACAELGIEPATRSYTDDEPIVFVVSMNLKRRHLTTGQRAEVIRGLLPQLHEEGRRRKGEAGQSAAPGRPAERVDTKTQSFTEGRAREQAGALAGVSGATVDRINRLAREAPDLHAEVVAGEKTVTGAARELRERTTNGAKRKAAAAPTLDSNRGQQVAHAHKRRIETLVGTCQSFAAGTDDLRVEQAVQVSTTGEVAAWASSIRSAEVALQRVRSRLKERPPHEVA